METKSALCIVLRVSNYNDNDKILTLLSQEEGKITAMARGCRKSASSLLSCTDVFCCAQYLFQVNKERYYITQAEQKASFYDIRKNMDALLAGMLFLEVAEKCAMPSDGSARLFALLASALHALSGKYSPRMATEFFVFKLLDILGLKPVINECALCGKKEVAKLNIPAGGGVCSACPGEEIDPAYFQAIGRILSTPSKNMASLELPVSKEFYELSLKWLRHALDMDIKALALLK